MISDSERKHAALAIGGDNESAESDAVIDVIGSSTIGPRDSQTYGDWLPECARGGA